MNFVIKKTIEVIDQAATGKKFAALRKEARLFQRQVAYRCGISMQHLQRLEQGRRNWTEQMIQDLGQTLQEMQK